MRSNRRALWISIVLVLLWLVIGGALGSQQSKVSQVQTNDNTAFLPENAESTEELNLSKMFSTVQTTPAIVILRPGHRTDLDRPRQDQ